MKIIIELFASEGFISVPLSPLNFIYKLLLGVPTLSFRSNIQSDEKKNTMTKECSFNLTTQDVNFQRMSSLSSYKHFRTKTNINTNTRTYVSAGWEGFYQLASSLNIQSDKQPKSNRTGYKHSQRDEVTEIFEGPIIDAWQLIVVQEEVFQSRQLPEGTGVDGPQPVVGQIPERQTGR